MTCQLIIGKLPSYLFDELLKMNSDQTWTVQMLLTKLGKYVSHQESLARQREASDRSKKNVEVQKSENQTPTNILENCGITEKEKNMNLENRNIWKNHNCLFCGGDHIVRNCPSTNSNAERKTRLEQLHRCILCCQEGHVIADCPKKSSWKCSKCHKIGDHAMLICPI